VLARCIVVSAPVLASYMLQSLRKRCSAEYAACMYMYTILVYNARYYYVLHVLLQSEHSVSTLHNSFNSYASVLQCVLTAQ
jgi:hypothetical protein